MVEVKNDKYYIEKIISSIDTIISVSKGKTIEDLENDLALNNIVLFQFMLISENCGRLSENTRKQNSNISWSIIKGFRNVIVHNYDGVVYNTVMDTIENDLTKLKSELKKLL